MKNCGCYMRERIELYPESMLKHYNACDYSVTNGTCEHPLFVVVVIVVVVYFLLLGATSEIIPLSHERVFASVN